MACTELVPGEMVLGTHLTQTEHPFLLSHIPFILPLPLLFPSPNDSLPTLLKATCKVTPLDHTGVC